MTIDETRYQHVLLQIDDPGVWAGKSAGAGVGAHVGDPPVTHGERFRNAFTRVDCVEVAIQV